MTRIRFVGALAFALVSFTACDGLKEALTSHVDVAARAGSQELSVQKLADMMGKSKVPIRKDVAQSITDAWVNYQLLGQASAAGDSLTDVKLIDEVMWPVYTNAKTQKFYKQLSEKWTPDTSNLQAKFDSGELLAAKHILFMAPRDSSAKAGPDTALKKAESVRAKVTDANFAAMAKQYGSDGTKDVGGDLGVFPPGSMVPEFSKAIAALKPGEIGPLVHTQFGYHIVRRSTYDEVKDAFKQQYLQRQKFVSESTYIANVEKEGKIVIKPDVAKTVKAVGADPNGHQKDNTVVATSRLGDFKASQIARWILGFPNPDQIRGQIAQAPDSLMKVFCTNLLRNELILDEADKAKVGLDSTEMNDIRKSFHSILTNAWQGLRIAPAMLADSAKTKGERERLAAARIDAYLGRLVNGEEQFVEVPPPLVQALHKKYEWKVNPAALDKAVVDAQPVRVKADSARASQTPSSVVPLPGGTPAPRDTAKVPEKK